MEDQTFGQWISELRGQHGLTREQLAAEAGVSTRTIERCEDDVYMPRGKSLLRIFDILGVNTSRPAPIRPMALELSEIHQLLEEMSTRIGERGDTVSALQLHEIAEAMKEASTTSLASLLPELEEVAELIRQGVAVDERYAEKMSRLVAEAEKMAAAVQRATLALEEQLRRARSEPE